MRALLLVALLMAVFCTGCTTTQLAHNTVTQAHSHTDIVYRQILDNLAASECNPEVLPHFSVVGTGGTLVIDSGEANLGLAWDASSFIGTTLGLGASRSFEDGWTLAPVVDPDKLRAMRAAFQIATRGETNDPTGYSLLQSYLGPDYMTLIQPGWYGAGGKGDVPKCACYVSHCGDRYVWVTGDGLGGLSQMALVVLNVATLDSSAIVASTAVESAKALDTEDSADAEGIQRLPQPPFETMPRPRENYFNPLQSQIQMSR